MKKTRLVIETICYNAFVIVRFANVSLSLSKFEEDFRLMLRSNNYDLRLEKADT